MMILSAAACDDGPSPKSQNGTESSDTGLPPNLGPSSLSGDAICASAVTRDTCEGLEVEGGVVCGWRSSALLLDGAADCGGLELSEGCFAFAAAGGNPGCGPAPQCDTDLGFLQPYVKSVDGGTLVINACVGSEPINEFVHCDADARPLACQCVCELAPNE